MKNRRYVYIGADCIKSFKNFNQMKAWAMDVAHEGVYYISCPDITFKKSRKEIVNRGSPS